MKIKLTRLDFRKDPTFDPNGIIGEYAATPYIAEYKQHWWSMWHYIMDNTTYCPKLFYGDFDKIKVLKTIKNKT